MSYLNSVATASSRTLVKLVAALVFLLSLIVPAFAGEFQAHVDYTTGLDPASVAIGDFNRDKKVDVVVGNYDDDTESIFLGNGDGSFQPQLVFPSGTCPLWMTVVDINEDGIQDLIVTDHDSRQMLKEARDAGARGYLVKSQAASQLLAAVQALSEHRAFFANDLEG
jgi:hypothetical protein